MPVEVSCSTCSKVVAIDRYRVKERNYCSPACHYASGAPRPNRKTGITKACETCGKEFYTPRVRPDARFCSMPCKGKASRRHFTCEVCGTESYGFRNVNKRWCSRECAMTARRTGEHRTCIRCGEAFYVTSGRATVGQGRFCSLACHNIDQGRNKTDHTCKMCGESFRWSPSRTVNGNPTYCSIACRSTDPAWRAQLVAMQAIQQLGRTTRAEAAGYALLDALGVDYERQVAFKGKFTPDALVPSEQLVVQFDGDYWHDRKGTSTEPRILRRVALDLSQDAYIRACGWRVLRLWETDLLRDPDGCAEQIREHLRPPS